MKTPIRNDSYRLINLIFTAIIIAVIGYSLYFGGGKSHPIPSASKLLTGEETISSGLSRSFSAIVRFDFTVARQYNPYGIRIFIFMLIQLMMRITGFLLSRGSLRRQVIMADILISVLLFLIFFYPFITEIGHFGTSHAGWLPTLTGPADAVRSSADYLSAPC